MNLLKQVLEHDVFPATGCTEPSAVAYAAAEAGKLLNGEITEVEIIVDPGVYKNGFAVTIPNSNGEKGNLIAGTLGAMIKRPELKMEVLGSITDDLLKRAQELMRHNHAHIACDRSKKRLYIDIRLSSNEETARVVIEGAHRNIVLLEHNGQSLQPEQILHISNDAEFRSVLRDKHLSDFIEAAESLDAKDSEYINMGIEMNMCISQKGRELHKVGYYIAQLAKTTQKDSDLVSSCEVATSSAVDARMGGLNFPVMSSGGSGDQGVVAILVPYLAGQHYNIDQRTIIRSIAFSHLINSYVKCFTGNLSPLCGCAIAAGVGASAAIVYQQAGNDMHKITLAVNNLISDLGGILCDGAKEGCALKVASSTGSAIRSAHMAINGHGITQVEGFVGSTAEDTIKNLGKIGVVGMSGTNDAMLGIMLEKQICQQ